MWGCVSMAPNASSPMARKSSTQCSAIRSDSSHHTLHPLHPPAVPALPLTGPYSHPLCCLCCAVCPACPGTRRSAAATLLSISTAGTGTGVSSFTRERRRPLSRGRGDRDSRGAITPLPLDCSPNSHTWPHLLRCPFTAIRPQARWLPPSTPLGEQAAPLPRSHCPLLRLPLLLPPPLSLSSLVSSAAALRLLALPSPVIAPPPRPRPLPRPPMRAVRGMKRVTSAEAVGGMESRPEVKLSLSRRPRRCGWRAAQLSLLLLLKPLARPLPTSCTPSHCRPTPPPPTWRLCLSL